MSSIGNRIKEITVVINGDTTKLQTDLKQINANIRNTQSQLIDVERLLRLDPTTQNCSPKRSDYSNRLYLIQKIS